MLPSVYKSTQLQGITDLSLLCPIKPGFIDGVFDTESQVERLRRVLATLTSVRIFSREVAANGSAFPDPVGRFQGIHFFRFCVVDPLPGQLLSSGHQILLNVTFDGGWEPYMRLIWKPLGSLLDLIFCHNETYPQAWRCSFDDYCDWVRLHEVRGRFFYTDSGASVADAAYLKQLEALQRERGGQPGADGRAAALALPPPAAVPPPTPDSVSSAIRLLKAVYSLSALFPGSGGIDGKPVEGDAAILLRFARDLLPELRQWVAQGEFDPDGPFGGARAEPEISWLMKKPLLRRPKAGAPPFNPAAVQAGIAAPYALPRDLPTHGALVLLRVKDAALARAWLASAPVSRADGSGPADPLTTLAITYSGLAALGLPAAERLRFPREFIDGMEARAGILGDLRSNHPQYWQRPPRNWAGGTQVAPRPPSLELTSIHLLVQLRTAEQPGDVAPLAPWVLARLMPHIAALECTVTGNSTGLVVVSVQAGRSAVPVNGEPQPRNKFGFVDGISQPSLSAATPPPARWSDEVKRGELFLGYTNDRGDGPDKREAGDPIPAPDPLFDDGSFLVVRKLRLYPQRLDALIARAVVDTGLPAQTLRTKLMGRSSDGKSPLTPGGLSGNDFDYRQDAAGSACPFASHTRRSNPRERRADGQLPPRLMRRGFSYGTGSSDADDQGLVFMAYNASIAEQFEVIQRWITGGNASGVSSVQSDPFMGVPEPGVARTFRFEHQGQATRIDLGSQPLVSLQWGVYAFVPSIAALQQMPVLCKPATPPTPWPPDPSPLNGSFADWKAALEDAGSREAAWAEVRRRGGVLATPYGLLVGSAEHVLQVLQDDGLQFSACGYGQRMAASIGLGYLGQDDAGPHAGHAEPWVEAVNLAVEAITQADAFDLARQFTTAMLPGTGTLDLERLAGGVIAALCRAWFGAPDNALIDAGGRSDDPQAKARCPGHLLAVSRHVFSPHPSDTVKAVAAPQGKTFTDAIEQMLAAPGAAAAPLTRAILAARGPDATARDKAELVSGIMLGFPATVLGNLLTLLKLNAESRELWDWQALLFSQVAAPWAADEVLALLRAPLLAALRRSTVPFMDWRIGQAGASVGGVTLTAETPVIVGLGSALAGGGDDMLIFGGSRDVAGTKTRHACPGYKLSVGVLLGFFTTLLTAGELRPTADPRLFTFTRL